MSIDFFEHLLAALYPALPLSFGMILSFLNGSHAFFFPFVVEVKSYLDSKILRHHDQDKRLMCS
jgi:hypothetical protein